MVLAHVVDSWTREADRASDAFYRVGFLGGLAAPLFLFLAGVATAMSAAAKARRQGSHHTGAQMARRRGWEIFALAFVFRAQAQLLGLGPLENLLKVDILNVMGLSIVAASYLWEVSTVRRARVAVSAAAVVLVALATPTVRDVTWLARLPDAIEAYVRPAGSYAAFPAFPWAAFVFGGVIAGDLVDGLRRPAVQLGFAIAGTTGIVLAWIASLQPSIYESASFWHDSPTFFFIRLGIVVVLVPVAWGLERVVPSTLLRPLATMGKSSLFVYWIHVEMVYGVVSEPIKRALPLWTSLAALLVFCAFLYALVLLKNRLLERHELRGPWRRVLAVVR